MLLQFCHKSKLFIFKISYVPPQVAKIAIFDTLESSKLISHKTQEKQIHRPYLALNKFLKPLLQMIVQYSIIHKRQYLHKLSVCHSFHTTWDESFVNTINWNGIASKKTQGRKNFILDFV